MEVLGLGGPKSPRGGLETSCVCQLTRSPPTTVSWFSLSIWRTTELEITGCPPALSSRQGHIWSPPLTLPKGCSQAGRWRGAGSRADLGKQLKSGSQGERLRGWGRLERGPGWWGKKRGKKEPELISPSEAAWHTGL